MKTQVIHGDCLMEIPKLVASGVVVDSVVCDPPYHLTPTVKRFSKEGSAPAKFGKDGAMARLSTGFMSAKWDGGDLAFRPETWATVATILRPGAFLVAFGGTRTHHRLACAIEDGGFVIQDSILDLISSDARVQRFVATLTPAQVDAFSQVLDDMQPTGALAWTFGTGFPKRRDNLKPAFEPIVLAYKPGGKRTMQIDECRIPAEKSTKGPVSPTAMWGSARNLPGTIAGSDLGRWPANVCHDGSDDVLAAFAACGERSSHDTGAVNRSHPAASHNLYKSGLGPMEWDGRADSGSAARFFFSAKAGDLDRWTTTRHELTLSWTSGQNQYQAVLLVAMALSPPRVIAASGSTDAQEWNTFLFGSGLTDLCRKASKSTIRTTISSTTGLQTWSWLTHLLTSDCIPVATLSMANGSSRAEDAESTSLSISFTLGETASLPNADPVLSGASFRISGQEKRVGHPTVKPISLMRWLVKLVCPEGGLVLDPFAGIGTTGLAATAENRNAILIELELSYIADIRERMAHYEGGGRHSLASRGRQAKPRGETPLFDRPYDEAIDAHDSYLEAVRAVGAKVRAGEPVPAFFLGDNPEEAE